MSSLAQFSKYGFTDHLTETQSNSTRRNAALHLAWICHISCGNPFRLKSPSEFISFDLYSSEDAVYESVFHAENGLFVQL